ncbi:MAG: leucine-rich repeat domain-containing protein [Candidatus Kapabacteria bacterium]|jgi:Leucine-rich repeat (LRR) protein|nr:leucine-rich repeat domain-containing protein [Candidatus Kapabacteria bacterium]
MKKSNPILIQRLEESKQTRDEMLYLLELQLTGEEEELNELAVFSWVKRLNIEGNQIHDISFLKGITTLETLKISHNQITDISPLRSLNTLKSLNLSHNLIEDCSILPHLANLVELDLAHNAISDISFLKGMTELESLFLSENQISDISSVQYLKKLDYLDADENIITDVSPLKDLPNLSWIMLEKNRISDISPLYGCEFTRLLLQNNLIEGLPRLPTVHDEFGIEGNPIMEKIAQTLCTTLKFEDDQIPTIQFPYDEWREYYALLEKREEK